MMSQTAATKFLVQPSSGSQSFEKVIRDLINRRFFVETEQYTDLSDWLDKRRKYKSCGIISGSRGAGKSRAAKEYDAIVTGRRGSMRRIKPLHSLYIKAFSSWGTRDLCRQSLNFFNHGAKKGNPMDIRLRTWETFEDFGLELLLVDNGHLLSEKILLDLVECYDEFKIATVLIGPDKDLENRLESLGLRKKFNSHHKFPSLSPKQVVEVLKAFKSDFLSLPEGVKLFDGEVVHAICQASGGNPSKLEQPGCDFNTISEILVLSIAQSSNDEILLDKRVLKEVLYGFGVNVELTVEEPNDTGTGISG
ncbi:AAA family ATPase [Phormidesmis sp. 146-33]